MFDIGFSELLLIAVVALVVLGPERLPKAARLAGLWARKARAQWNAVKAELENEIADEELRRNLREASDAMRDGVQQARALPDALRNNPLATATAAMMTSLDPAKRTATHDASMQSEPLADVPNHSVSADVAASDSAMPASAPMQIDPARLDPAQPDPAQLNLLAPDPTLQMTALPPTQQPRSDG